MIKRLQYWDSCLFIAILANNAHEKERIEVIRHLLKEEELGNIGIVASTFVTAEVRPDETIPALDPKQFAQTIELMQSDRIDWRPVTPSIAEQAQRMGKDFPDLSPCDCVHIATAIAAGVRVLFTHDGDTKKRKRGRMLNYNGKIGNPPLKITIPTIEYGPLYDKEDQPQSIEIRGSGSGHPESAAATTQTPETQKEKPAEKGGLSRGTDTGT